MGTHTVPIWYHCVFVWGVTLKVTEKCRLCYTTFYRPKYQSILYHYRDHSCSVRIKRIRLGKNTRILAYFIMGIKVKVKVKVWTLAIAPLTWVRLVTSSALQSRKWQMISMSQWCRSALCGHPLPALTDNWTHGAASRHTIAQISHTKPSLRSRSYLFPVPL